MPIKKFFSWAKPSSRKVKAKNGTIRTVRVKPHVNKINRKPRKK